MYIYIYLCIYIYTYCISYFNYVELAMLLSGNCLVDRSVTQLWHNHLRLGQCSLHVACSCRDCTDHVRFVRQRLLASNIYSTHLDNSVLRFNPTSSNPSISRSAENSFTSFTPPFSAGIKLRFPNFEGQRTDLIPGPTGSKLPRFCLWVKTTRSCENPRHAVETGRQDDGVRLDSWGHGFTAGSSFEELSLTGHRCSMP